MNILQGVLLGLVQGLTEFLPVSSSGHLILAREFLHLPLENSLTFDVFLNTATLLAVIYCFWGDIRRIVLDLFTGGFSSRSKTLVISLIVGTIPAGLIGFKYSHQIEDAFRSTHSVAWALIVGSIIMIIGDYVNRSVNHTSGISAVKGFFIGIFQSLALIPGVSRSGASISGGLMSKLSREEAIRFSFLLYIPISAGALLKSVLDPSFTPHSLGEVGPSIFAFIAALISGLWAVKFMVKYLSRKSFTPFIIYRILLAIVIFIFL